MTKLTRVQFTPHSYKPRTHMETDLGLFLLTPEWERYPQGTAGKHLKEKELQEPYKSPWQYPW